MAGMYNVEFAVDGSGDHRIYLPADAGMHDVLALGPVIQAVNAYLEPTIAPTEPIKYVLSAPADAKTSPPDLTA